MRAMVSCGQWSGSGAWRAHRVRYGVPVAFMMAPMLALGVGVAGIVIFSIGIAVVATVAAVALSLAVTAGVFGALGFVLWQVARHTVPGLGKGGPPRRRKGSQRREDTASWTGESPVDVLRRRYAAGEIGQTAFRAQLTDLLKERYVRGDLTLAEFESRVRQIYQDPALRPPAA
jgi:hypothetical protein